jgi:hypothetical protein
MSDAIPIHPPTGNAVDDHSRAAGRLGERAAWTLAAINRSCRAGQLPTS